MAERKPKFYKQWALNLLNWFGRHGVAPFMRWLTDGQLEFQAPERVEGPAVYTSSEGCPLTVWLLGAARKRMNESETLQRDLNGCLELMELDSYRQPLLMMYAALLAEGEIPIDQIFMQVFANVLLLGFTAGVMSVDGPRHLEVTDKVDAEFTEDDGATTADAAEGPDAAS